jgi:hypothetical protein
MHVMPGAQPCGQVQELLQKLFPQETLQRASEVAAQQQQSQQQQDDGAAEAEAAAAAERRKAHLQQLQALLREQTAPGAGGASSSSSSSTREAWRQITDLVAQDADETYTWWVVRCCSAACNQGALLVAAGGCWWLLLGWAALRVLGAAAAGACTIMCSATGQRGSRAGTPLSTWHELGPCSITLR